MAKKAKKKAAKKAAKKTASKAKRATKRKAGGKKRKAGKKHKSGHAGHPSVAKPTFGGKKYDCYGKRVRTGKGKKTAPRVFCARVEAAAA